MSKRTVFTLRVAMSLWESSDAERAALLAGIAKMAPESPLSQVPSIAAILAELAVAGSALATSTEEVSAAEGQLRAKIAQRESARTALDRMLVAFKALVENVATSESDIAGVGLKRLVVQKPSMTQPEPPLALDVKIGRARGKARVVVAGKGKRAWYVAEVALDGAGPLTWASLPGTGKARTLAGHPTGTRLWVRFAEVRFGMQSDWCTPVLVTIP